MSASATIAASTAAGTPSLDDQLEDFRRRRMIAMPIAGTIAWAVVAVAGVVATPFGMVMTLFAATGVIPFLGMAVSKLTGEDFLDRSRPKNAFDGLFFHTVAMSLLVYAIAIPFLRVDHTSLPLTVGVLSGLMWLPLSWIIGHWVGVFHAGARTLGIVVAWYAFPDARFVAIPLVIIAVYLVSIVVLERRWRARALA